ncbi:4aa34d9b-737b-464e-86c0-5e32afcf8621 [Sclerotinia trifoliorum]|uniref:4aa34d9b-737b-464e-86c0-5e32afcf8621 n=1 Tax=Sclerotinia trifoliorum TaxID=28548 RepID=A0A8H2W1P3_9HELO|nr:4aa34d9b-737b-464e-86c0-5e32afcf8621 [Sclerotinia trifoliorum]
MSRCAHRSMECRGPVTNTDEVKVDSLGDTLIMSDSATTSAKANPKRKRSSTSRSKQGCLTCRTKKVKCDERLPCCRRCERLKLNCQQSCSRILPSVRDRRRGVGPLKSRNSDWSPQPLSPALQVSEEQPPNSETLLNHYLSGYEHGLVAASASLFLAEDSSDISQCEAPNIETEANTLLNPASDWILPGSQCINAYASTYCNPISFEQLSIANISSAQEIVSENGMSLTVDEELALAHYRTAFSLTQTTRDPKWSTPALLLLHGLKHSQMLLHLILAVSLYDTPSDPVNVSRLRQTGHKHYEKGTEHLMLALQSEGFPDHLAVVGSFYCIQMYMSRSHGTIIPKLDQLSIAATEHLKKYNLIVPIYGQSHSNNKSMKERAERSLIARMIMWLLKIDAQGSFLGCKPSLVNYFQAHPDHLSAVQAESRLALQLNWGAEYPISQSIRDIESCLPVDMMTDMLVLYSKISEFSQLPSNIQTSEMLASLQKELAALEIRYGAVFYYGSSEMTLQPAMKLNCANSATMYSALQIYFARSGSSSFGEEATPDIKAVLSQLLLFAMHVCPAGSKQPVYEFQWSLFIAAVETNDMIHQEWLQARITNHRLRKALQRISSFKRSNMGKISLSKVREIFWAV